MAGGGSQAVSDRREFLTVSAASVLTVLLTDACGGSGGDAVVLTGPASFSVQVSTYPTLANVGGIARVANGGTPIAAVRTGADTFAAVSLITPHPGCTMC